MCQIRLRSGKEYNSKCQVLSVCTGCVALGAPGESLPCTWNTGQSAIRYHDLEIMKALSGEAKLGNACIVYNLWHQMTVCLTKPSARLNEELSEVPS